MKNAIQWTMAISAVTLLAVGTAWAGGDKVRQNNGNENGATPRTGVAAVLATDEALPADAPSGTCTQTQTRTRQRDRVQARACQNEGVGACEGKAAGTCEQKQTQQRRRAQSRACKSK